MAEEKNEQSCGTCKYYMINNLQDVRQGICRRNPPAYFITMVPQGIVTKSDFPLTLKTNWCGEYQTKISLIN